jgi:hypothetical protein
MIIKLQDLAKFFKNGFKEGFPDCNFIIISQDGFLQAGQIPNQSSVNLFKSDFEEIDIDTILIEHNDLIYKIVNFSDNIIGIVPV